MCLTLFCFLFSAMIFSNNWLTPERTLEWAKTDLIRQIKYYWNQRNGIHDFPSQMFKCFDVWMCDGIKINEKMSNFCLHLMVTSHRIGCRDLWKFKKVKVKLGEIMAKEKKAKRSNSGLYCFVYIFIKHLFVFLTWFTFFNSGGTFYLALLDMYYVNCILQTLKDTSWCSSIWKFSKSDIKIYNS